MRFVILGSGAIGGTVGGKLAAAGKEVALIARGEHRVAIRAQGLRLETPEGATTVRPAVFAHVEEVDWRFGDVVLLAVKSQDAAGALRELATAAPPETPVACLTNGIEAERLALRHFERVLGVTVFAPAAFLEPGVIQVWSSPVPGVLDVGPYVAPAGGESASDGGSERERRGAARWREELALCERLVATWRGSGFVASVQRDVMRGKRGKLLANLSNAAEALCGPAGRTSKAAAAARAEGVACYEAAGLSTTTAEEDAARWSLMTSRPIAGRDRAGGSTWQSLARGGSVECDYLNGEIALLGRLHGVATPVNGRLQRMIATAARAGVRPGGMTVEALDAELGL
jgi:2-dehydropantoate 2-reductase